MIHGLGSQIHLLSLAASYAEEFGANQTLVKVHVIIYQDDRNPALCSFSRRAHAAGA